MRLISISPHHIPLKYSASELPLVMEYIGPNRSHGEDYFSEDYHWYECFDETYDQTLDINNGAPLGIVCLTEKKWLPLSLHLSVIETLRKGNGDGTKIMDWIIGFGKLQRYKSMTLQAHSDDLIRFYDRFGFKVRYYFNVKIMRLYL